MRFPLRSRQFFTSFVGVIMIVIGLALSAALAFLVGSIPTGLLAGFARGIDIRKHGSGNIGATNAVRALGTLLGALVFIGDAFKGWMMVTIGFSVLSSALSALDPSFKIPGAWNHELLHFLIATSVVAGHVWSVFLKFDGGKGVATGVGVFLGMDLLIAFLGLGVFALVVIASRYISLGSLVGTFTACGLSFALTRGMTSSLSAAVIFMIVLIRHRENITRLRNGTERKFSFRKNLPTIAEKK